MTRHTIARVLPLILLALGVSGSAEAAQVTFQFESSASRVYLAGEFNGWSDSAQPMERNADGLAMSELPWVLAEIAEPSALPLIRRFLDHPSADVAAAAIEALAQLQDPEALADLERFVGDKRLVVIEDFEDETKTPRGELAEDAREMLGVRPSDKN